MKPPQTAAGGEPAVAAVMASPQNADHLVVVPRSSTACIMTLKGQVGLRLFCAAIQRVGPRRVGKLVLQS